jgi:UDP-3-O-[3-hydroxymyristoyl] N-acetylglucosamine deacetylase/3-hydroxyacyl-[acyl-carrier-protein] dehydratase
MFKHQQTIKKEASCSGIGLHTGNKTTVTFKPAPINTGIRFVRVDQPDRPVIPADIEHVTDISRGTTLGINGVKVHTVEHLLAALVGLGIDNVIVEINANEPPVGDGSALHIVNALTEAGIVEQDSPKDYLVVEEMIRYDDVKKKGIELMVLPSDEFRITFMSHPKRSTVGAQYTVMFSLEDEFVTEYAPARTFGFLSEVEKLREQGLIKGGTLDNALIIIDKPVNQNELDYLRKLFNLKETVSFGKNGIVNGTPLRFPDEFCRHKTSDLIGDLALLGNPIKGHVMAVNSGHAANIELIKKIRKIYQKKEIRSKYQKIKSKDFLFDVNAIQKIMPHRYPFLLVDRIIDLVPGERVIGLKNVTINEQFFNGHFPGQPVMPGVLQIEAMAQVGGVLMLNTVDNPQDKLVYFASIDKAKFRKPVVPGDQIRFELEMLQYRRRTSKMQGKAFVDGDLVAEAELTAMVVDKKRENSVDS